MRKIMNGLMLLALPLGLLQAQAPVGKVAPMNAGGPAAMRALSTFLVGKFGTSVIYEAELRCGSRELCKSEAASPAGKANASARREALRQEFLVGQQGVRVGSRSSSVTCDATDCRVRGASRFVQIKEPVMQGDTAIVALHVYENATKNLVIRSYRVKMMNAQSKWSVLSIDRLGFSTDS